MTRLRDAVLVISLSLPLALEACVPSIDATEGPVVVGPEGGLFIRKDKGYAIDVPRGALSGTVTIDATITDSDVPEVALRKRVSLGFRLSPSGLTFATPARLYLPWLPDCVPAAVAPSSFDMRRSAGSEIAAQLPGARTNTTPVEAVEALTDRLGLFWITSPNEPEGARLEIDPTEASIAVSESQRLTARVIGPDQQPLEVSISWSAVPPRVGQVDAHGTFTAAAPGVATVTATFGAQSASAKVSVAGTTKGPSSFVHENPFPTGNDFLGGSLVPGALGFVFAGANGTVLVRTPDGAFSRLASLPGLTLRQIAGSTLGDAVAIGRAGSSGVLVELRGASPRATVYPSKKVSELDAVWFDGVSGMAVGAGNEVAIHRDGGWTTEYHPSFETLLSVVGDGRGGFVVVGDLGSLYRWDPARGVWDSLFDPALSVKLEAAQLVDVATPEAWATGGDRLWHFVGNGWVEESLPTEPARAKTTCVGALDGRISSGRKWRSPRPAPHPLSARCWFALWLRCPTVARRCIGPLSPCGASKYPVPS